MEKLLTDKWLLIDTNFLIHFAEFSDKFQEIVLLLNRLRVNLIIDHTIEFEFLRSANSLLETERRRKLLDDLLGNSRKLLSFRKEVFHDSLQLAECYSRLNGRYNSQISFQDCLLGAHLKQYSGNLFLATSDHDDFPLKIFDRIAVYTVDAGEKIIPIGFYQFNSEKYEKISRDFVR